MQERNNKCSTPFGITEFDTLADTAELLAYNLCSTPFGITEFDTRIMYS